MHRKICFVRGIVVALVPHIGGLSRIVRTCYYGPSANDRCTTVRAVAEFHVSVI